MKEKLTGEPLGVKVRYLCFGTHFSTEFEGTTRFTEHSGRTHSRVSCEDLHIIQWTEVVALPSWLLEKIASFRHQPYDSEAPDVFSFLMVEVLPSVLLVLTYNEHCRSLYLLTD
jgi:hypothetical protein